MMMIDRALPIELLDEDEIKQRFKQIDEAIERVKHDIEHAAGSPKGDKPRVKLHDRNLAVAPLSLQSCSLAAGT